MKQKQSFMFVTEYYSPIVMGGAEVSLKISVDSLVRHGHSVTIVTPNYLSYKTVDIKKSNLRIIRFRSLRKFLFSTRKSTSQNVYKSHKPLFYFLIALYVRFSALELKYSARKILNKNKFDFIHANNLESLLAICNIVSDSKKLVHFRDFGLFLYC